MRIGEVIGTVTLSKAVPSMKGVRYRLVVPLSLANLTGSDSHQAEELVACDSYGAGIDSRVAFSEGREAAQPFGDDDHPVDASIAALLDEINVEPLS